MSFEYKGIKLADWEVTNEFNSLEEAFYAKDAFKSDARLETLGILSTATGVLGGALGFVAALGIAKFFPEYKDAASYLFASSGLAFVTMAPLGLATLLLQGAKENNLNSDRNPNRYSAMDRYDAARDYIKKHTRK